MLVCREPSTSSFNCGSVLGALIVCLCDGCVGRLLVCRCRTNKERTTCSNAGYLCVELRLTTKYWSGFFANLTGNRTSFSAWNSEETGGNGLLLCPCAGLR